MDKNRIWYIAEFVIVFIGLPLAFYLDWFGVPKLVALGCIAISCVLVLKFDTSFDFSNMFAGPDIQSGLKTMLPKSAGVAAGIILLVLLIRPESLFVLPKELPWMWGFLILVYPVLSVLPQEIIYRVYFFERYRTLFKKDYQVVALSALSFSFLHIVYDNWWAVVLSLIGGMIFSLTYYKSRSLWLVSLEHAVYGWMVFTIGMGNYFYEAV